MPFLNIGQYLTEHNIADELAARYGTRFYETVNQLRDVVIDSRTQIRRVITLTTFMMLGYFQRHSIVRNTLNLSFFVVDEEMILMFDYFRIHKMYMPIWFYRHHQYYTIDYSIPINHFISYLYRERGYTSLAKYVSPEIECESGIDYECTICMNEFENVPLANMICTEKPVFPCMNEKKICPTCVDRIKRDANICPYCKDDNTFYVKQATKKMIYSHNRKKYTFDLSHLENTFDKKVIIFDTTTQQFISSCIEYKLEDDMLYDDDFIFENITSMMTANELYNHLPRQSERLVGNSPTSIIFDAYLQTAHDGDNSPLLALYYDDNDDDTADLRIAILDKYPVEDRCSWFNRNGWGHVEHVGVNTREGEGYICIEDASFSNLLKGDFESDSRLVFWGDDGGDYAFDNIIKTRNRTMNEI